MNKIVYGFARLVFLVIFYAFLNTTFLFGQSKNNVSQYTFWLNGGSGISSVGSVAGNFGLIFLDRYVVWTLRGSFHEESVGLFSFEESYYDIGIRMGYAYSRIKWHASVAAGFSVVSGFTYKYNGDPDCFLFCEERVKLSPVVGIPLEIKLFRNLKHVGLGINLVGNYNKLQSFGAVNFNISLGKLR